MLESLGSLKDVHLFVFELHLKCVSITLAVPACPQNGCQEKKKVTEDILGARDRAAPGEEKAAFRAQNQSGGCQPHVCRDTSPVDRTQNGSTLFEDELRKPIHIKSE